MSKKKTVWINPPTKEDVRIWVVKEYGNVFWKGQEVPFWDTSISPPEYRTRLPYANNRFITNRMKRADLVFERHGVIWICETDPFPLYSSIGQLLAAKFWLPRCYPNAYRNRRLRCYLFVSKDDSVVRMSARSAGIRTIILKK